MAATNGNAQPTSTSLSSFCADQTLAAARALAALPNQAAKESALITIGSSNCACPAEVVSSSIKFLRQKGSSFLRTHASKHGITNASRKLTSQVLAELTQHYIQTHRVDMIFDDYAQENSHTAPANTTVTRQPFSNDVTNILPKHPVPPTQLQVQHLRQGLKQSDAATVLKKQHNSPPSSHLLSAPGLQPQPPPCVAAIIARSRSELAACGTSMLRPEAAAHKVHNASRKNKSRVIEELWLHYVSCHSSELADHPPNKKLRVAESHPPKTTIAQVAAVASAVAEGWVGSVIDEDDDPLKV